MPRVVGTPGMQELITIPVTRDHVITTKSGRYVFIETFSNKVRRLCLERLDNLKLYQRFVQAITRRRYNTATIYGCEAINIDDPHDAVVSVWLKFVVVDESAPCSYDVIKKDPTL